LTGANAQSLSDLSGTWNTSGAPTALKLNITNTASGAASVLQDLQVNGSSIFRVGRSGEVAIQSFAAGGSGYLNLYSPNFAQGFSLGTWASSFPSTPAAINTYSLCMQWATGAGRGIVFGANSGNSTMELLGTEDAYLAYFRGVIAVGVASPNANAIMDLTSTTKAFMPPRMTTTQKNAIASPTSGMVVYDSTLGKLCVRGASAWETVTST